MLSKFKCSLWQATRSLIKKERSAYTQRVSFFVLYFFFLVYMILVYRRRK